MNLVVFLSIFLEIYKKKYGDDNQSFTITYVLTVNLPILFKKYSYVFDRLIYSILHIFKKFTYLFALIGYFTPLNFKTDPELMISLKCGPDFIAHNCLVFISRHTPILRLGIETMFIKVAFL